jgi:hypothetical protein
MVFVRNCARQMVQQADAVRFLGFDNACGEQQFLRHRPANLIGQRPRAVDPPIRRCEEAELATLATDAHVER